LKNINQILINDISNLKSEIINLEKFQLKHEEEHRKYQQHQEQLSKSQIEIDNLTHSLEEYNSFLTFLSKSFPNEKINFAFLKSI
jgi:hypothetical protein